MKESGGECFDSLNLQQQLMLRVDRQGTPTVKAFNHLDKGVAQPG